MDEEQQEPGTWKDLGIEIEVRDGPRFDPAEHYKTAKPSYSESFERVLRFYQERFGVPQSVLYPGCDMDATPVRAFPNSRVLLLDINKNAVDALQRDGIDAVASDIKDYHPQEQHDLLILLNPGFSTSRALHTVQRGGHIIANDYHGNTTQMLWRPWRYRFEGTVHHGRNPMEMLGIKESKELLRKTDPFFTLYNVFQRRF
jgi:hypothetical protein